MLARCFCSAARRRLIACSGPVPGVLSGPALERIEKSPLDQLIVTNTIPLKQESSKIKVLNAAELFARIIRRVYVYESISELFI